MSNLKLPIRSCGCNNVHRKKVTLHFRFTVATKWGNLESFISHSNVPLRTQRFSHMLTVAGRFVAVSETKKKSRWFWPLGLVTTAIAGAAVVVFRGCWHSKMSWPVRSLNHSYQVCLNCGIKRLFDDKNFRSYGPYSYDLVRLIAWDKARQQKQAEAEPTEHRTAS